MIIVLPLLILIGLLVIAYVVYIAVIYWYITIPIIGFIIFCLKADTIGKWIGKKRYKRHLAAQIKKREKQAKIILEQKRIKDIKLQQLQEQKERKFWNDFRNKWEEQQIVQPALPDYTIKHKPKPRQTKKKSPKTLQDAMKQAFQAQIERKPVLDIKKCYKILGLTQEASVLQVQLRFKELALKYHPDRNIDSKSAAKKFAEVCEARQQILQLIQVAA